MEKNISKIRVNLKSIVKGFYKDGEIITDGEIRGYIPTEDQQRICNKICHLLLDDNGLLWTDTKNELSGTRDFGENALPKNTSLSRINYDINNKLYKILGAEMLDEICRKREGFEKNEKKIDDLLKKYPNKSIFDKLAFRVKHSGVKANRGGLSDMDKVNIVEMFDTYNRKKLQAIENSMTPEMIGYIKYLEKHNDKLDGEDQEIWETINEC